MKGLQLVVLSLFLGSCCCIPGLQPSPYKLLPDSPKISKSDAVYPVNIGCQDNADTFNCFIKELSSQLITNFYDIDDPQGPVAVTTFVDLNNLYKTSPLGRYIAEALIGELQQADIMVTEIRKTNSILIKEGFGEYSLSRNIKEIARQSTAEYLLVGTYIVRGDNIFVNARIVSSKDSMVVSSASAHLKRNCFLDKMLWPSKGPRTSPQVTIPIKPLGDEMSVEIIPQGS